LGEAERYFLITDHCSLHNVGTFPQVPAMVAGERGMKEKE
jgi:hypothetical protein